MPIEQDRIAAVRRFNRSLGEARALHEMADNKSPTATDIACSLDLDAAISAVSYTTFKSAG